MHPARPWFEITTDNYAPRIYPDLIGGAAWIASTERVRELLKDQHAGLYRVRVVLRDAVDFEPRFNRNPDWVWHYSRGPDLVMSFAVIVIERKNGRRVRVEL